jgi:hypothetical protein
MTKKYNFIVIGVALIISATIWIVQLNKQNTKKERITAKVFQSLNGWGYDILVNNALFIHQESVPGRQGKTGFPEKKQAEQTAQLIINKMERGELPAVTTFELEQIIPLK